MNKLFTLYILLLCHIVVAQQSDPNKPQDTLKVSYLDEVVISANKIPEQRRAVAQQIKIITPELILNLGAQTSADLLQNTGLVAMQRSQQGGGSLMLRGFEASRVLLMVDGIRMNNLIYRAGHLQNVITMDNNTLDRAEVLFGPASTVYGSDALGGVVHFYTRKPELAKDKTLFKGNAFTRFGSANNEKTLHADFTLSGKRFGSLTSFTFSDFGDLRMGEKKNPSLGEDFGLRPFYARRLADNSGDELVANSDPYVQKFSGYKQYDLLQKFLFAQSERVQHVLNFQYSTSTNIPRYDRLTDPQGGGLRSAEWYYGPQERLMGSYQLKINDLGALADGLIATASYQAIEESRHDRRFNNNNLNHRTENVDVVGLTLDMQKKIGEHSLRYGFDGQFNKLKSTAMRENISTGAETDLDTRYPDGNNSLNYWALYATHTFEISDKLILNDGIRFGGSTLNAEFKDKTFFPFPYDDITQKNLYGSGSLGLIYNPTSWKFSLMGSSGYRVPNIDDLAKVFESVVGSATTTGVLIVPNPDLKPEKTVNLDLSVTKFFGDKVQLEWVGFATQLFDAMAVRPTTFDGQSNVTYGGFSADVFSTQNVNRAYLYGWNGQVKFDLTRQLSMRAYYNYTFGRVKVNDGADTPLDHIAPQFGRVQIAYHTSTVHAELFSNFSGKKFLSDYSSSGEDNLQYAPVSGMPNWWTLNFRAGYSFKKWITLQAGVDNILDLQYRTFASGINSPGRNFFGTLRVRF
jgi:hemoglobin/transferrin/lactoferrin receptor protein